MALSVTLPASLPGPSGHLRRWRASWPARLFYWSLAAGFLRGAIAMAFPAFTDPGNLPLLPLLVLLLGEAAFLGYLPSGYIDLYLDRVVIGGAFRRHREINLLHLISVTPGRNGLYFRSNFDKGASGPACIGAKGPGLELLRYGNRGDQIRAAITAAATEAKHRPPRGAD